VSVDFTFPEGLAEYDNDGDPQNLTVDIQIRQRLLGAEDLVTVTTLSISRASRDVVRVTHCGGTLGSCLWAEFNTCPSGALGASGLRFADFRVYQGKKRSGELAIGGRLRSLVFYPPRFGHRSSFPHGDRR
jgi:hypothetical protein